MVWTIVFGFISAVGVLFDIYINWPNFRNRLRESETHFKVAVKYFLNIFFGIFYWIGMVIMVLGLWLLWDAFVYDYKFFSNGMNNFEMADKTRGVTAFLFLLVGLLFGSPLIGSWARDENNIVGRIFRIFFNIVLPAGALFLIIGTLFRLNFDFDNIINIVSETITRYF